MKANPSLRWGPGDFTPDPDDRYEAEERAAEAIEAEANKVLELVEDNIDSNDSPLMDSLWAAELMVALRESKSVFSRLRDGQTLEQAMVSAAGSDHFRHLMRCADVADDWIADQIQAAAVDKVDEAETRWAEDRGEDRFDALNGGW